MAIKRQRSFNWSCNNLDHGQDKKLDTIHYGYNKLVHYQDIVCLCAFLLIRTSSLNNILTVDWVKKYEKFLFWFHLSLKNLQIWLIVLTLSMRGDFYSENICANSLSRLWFQYTVESKERGNKMRWNEKQFSLFRLELEVQLRFALHIWHCGIQYLLTFLSSMKQLCTSYVLHWE